MIISGINERRETEVWVCWYGCCDLYAWSWPLRIESVRPHITIDQYHLPQAAAAEVYRGFSNIIDIHYVYTQWLHIVYMCRKTGEQG